MLLTLSWGALAGCALAEAPPSPDARSEVAAVSARADAGSAPLAELAPPDQARLEGQVVEVLPAGGYTYFALDVGESTRWVVIMGEAPEPGQRVVVRNFGAQRDFHSARLGRAFEQLDFGSLEVG